MRKTHHHPTTTTSTAVIASVTIQEHQATTLTHPISGLAFVFGITNPS
jgi:hypothetical protein